MFRSLMEKGTSLPVNPSIQSTEGIMAPNPAAAPRSAMRHSSMGENLPEPAKLEVNSGPGANVQQREILELPSTEIRAQRGLFPRILMEENTKVVSNLDEDPKELKKIIDGIVETEAMHHVMYFDPPPEGNTHIPELEIVVGDVRWKRVVEDSEISMESLEFLNAHKVLEKMSRNDIAFMEYSFHYSLRSTDSPSGFVFDPGKSLTCCSY